MSVEPKRAYKIVLIGDPEVGKTSIRRKYMGKSFRADYLKTLGADFAATKVNIDGDAVLLTIWDLAGQSIFHGMRSSFYHGCKCALVVVDVTKLSSLNHSHRWAEEASNFAKNSLQEIYLIGNKIDLIDDRVIQKNQIEEVAQKFREEFNFPVKVYETSALTGENINELFEHMSRRLIYGDTEEEEEESMLNVPPKEIVSQSEPDSKTEKSKTDSVEKLHNILADLEERIDQMQQSLTNVKKMMKELE